MRIHIYVYTYMYTYINIYMFTFFDPQKTQNNGRYLETRDAMLWRALHRELDAEGVRPVTPDARRLVEREGRQADLEDELADAVYDVAAEQDGRDQLDLDDFYSHLHAQVLLPTGVPRSLETPTHYSQA